MAGDMEVRVSGTKEASRALRRLSGSVRADLLVDVMHEAAEPIVRSAKGRAPSDIIAEGIRVVNVNVGSGGEVTAEVGLPGGRKPWFHGLFVELGTGPRIQKTTGRRTGSMPADPFLRPAFDAEKNNVRLIFAEELRKRLEAVARG